MRGIYTIRSGDRVIATQENLITTAGKKAVLEYVAGYQKNLVGSLAVGVGTTAANVADKILAFEVSRQPVFATTIDYATSAVIFRAQIPASEEIIIQELGAYSSDNDASTYGSMLLLDFGTLDAWSAGTFSATNSRIGQALRLTSPASTTSESVLPDLNLDLSGYSDLDQFVAAIRANNGLVASVDFQFRTDASNYYTWTITSPATAVYATPSATKGSLTATGNPSWANITAIAVRVTSTSGGVGNIDFDGLRIEDVDANREESVLISRSILGSPVTKAVDVPLDIEYAITL